MPIFENFQHFLFNALICLNYSQFSKLRSKHYLTKKIKERLDFFPVKIQIPASFSLFVDVEFGKVEEVKDMEFDYRSRYKYKMRSQYQKTLERKEKRMMLSKIYL